MAAPGRCSGSTARPCWNCRAACPRPAACSSSSGPADTASPSQRLLGWEDSDAGKHGLGLMLDPGGRLHAILRNNGQSGDLVDAHPGAGFRARLRHLGFARHDAAPQRGGGRLAARGSMPSRPTRPSRPCDWAGRGPGSSPRFRGDLAEIRVYDRQLDEPERRLVEARIARGVVRPRRSPKRPRATHWPSCTKSCSRPVARSGSPRTRGERCSPPRSDRGWTRSAAELDALKKKPPPEIPRAVVVQDGGPKGTRHEGFKDAHVFLRGNPKRLGKTVPRGVPRVLLGAGSAANCESSKGAAAGNSPNGWRVPTIR